LISAGLATGPGWTLFYPKEPMAPSMFASNRTAWKKAAVGELRAMIVSPALRVTTRTSRWLKLRIFMMRDV
jgi:hypothetical protein